MRTVQSCGRQRCAHVGLRSGELRSGGSRGFRLCHGGRFDRLCRCWRYRRRYIRSQHSRWAGAHRNGRRCRRRFYRRHRWRTAWHGRSWRLWRCLRRRRMRRGGGWRLGRREGRADAWRRYSRRRNWGCCGRRCRLNGGNTRVKSGCGRSGGRSRHRRRSCHDARCGGFRRRGQRRRAGRGRWWSGLLRRQGDRRRRWYLSFGRRCCRGRGFRLARKAPAKPGEKAIHDAGGDNKE
jgi:hypothetical protein